MIRGKDPEVAAHAVLKQRYERMGLGYKLIRAWYDENGTLCIEANVTPAAPTNFIDGGVVVSAAAVGMVAVVIQRKET